MQKSKFSIVLSSLVLFCGLAVAQDEEGAKDLEYVRICSLYGDGYYYAPGFDTCINAFTGESVYQTTQGPIYSEIPLAARVSALEDTVKELELMLYGNQTPSKE